MWNKYRLLKVFFAVAVILTISSTAVFWLIFKATETELQYNCFAAGVRAFISALGLFMFNIDGNIVSELNAVIGQHPETIIYKCEKIVIFLLAILSGSWTISFIISLVYSRVKYFVKFHWRWWLVNKNRNHLYLFFGLNEQSRLLATSIHDNDPNSVIVFIDEATIGDNDTDGVQNIINIISLKKQTKEISKKIGANIAVSDTKLSEIDLPENYQGDVLKILGLGRVKHLINELKSLENSPKLHIFLLSDNEDENIRSLATLTKDTTIRTVANEYFTIANSELSTINAAISNAKNMKKEIPSEIDAATKSRLKKDIDSNLEKTIKEAEEKSRLELAKCLETTIYCHARLSGPNRVVEDLAIRKSITIKIVDSSHIAVDLLKKKIEYHPVNVVECSKTNPTTVSSLLDSMIIGFGEVGRDSFRFLYEFGAFLWERSTYSSSCRSPFRCTAIDIKMNCLKGTFSGIMPAINFTSDQEGHNVRIDLAQADYQDSVFFEKYLTAERAKTLNYVVIALPDDDKSIALASTIFTFVRRYRQDMSMLKIMVRVNKDENLDMMQKIANHFNYGYGSYTDNVPVINLFGCPRDIYSYDMIIDDSLKMESICYYDQYRKLNGGFESWHVRRYRLVNAAKKEGVADLDKLRELRRKETQDTANALHAATKIFLLKKALGETTDIESFKKICISENRQNRYGNYIYYDGMTHLENKIMQRLAMLEHIRWNASHELLGYTGSENDTDERQRIHSCLRNWEGLDAFTDDYKQYDFAVVETSVSQIQPNLN